MCFTWWIAGRENAHRQRRWLDDGNYEKRQCYIARWIAEEYFILVLVSSSTSVILPHFFLLHIEQVYTPKKIDMKNFYSGRDMDTHGITDVMKVTK